MFKILISLIILVLIFGVLFLSTKDSNINENFDIKNPLKKSKNNKNNRDLNCPNILIKNGKFIFLYNTQLASIPGINPIAFNSLEDYVEYVQWQRSQGIHCPVLFLLKGYDAQGKKRYQIRPSPDDLMGGLQNDSATEQIMNAKTKLLDAARNDPPYNKNQYPGFDPLNQYIGLETPLDKIFHENPNGISPNPMDSNWGGAKFTQGLVNKGYYKEDNVNIKVA